MEVVAAVFIRADKALVFRKRQGLSNAGLWEFPGGKREPGESLQQSLVREIAEELSVHIHVDHLQDKSLGYSVHRTDTAEITLHGFIISEWHGDFVLTDHDKSQWCSIDDLRSVKLSPADVPFVDRIEAYFQKV